MTRPRPTSPRVDAMFSELKTASEEYSAAKEQLDAGRIRFEAARERFLGIRRLAADVLSEDDWLVWKATHERVKYVGLKIGDAIMQALRDRALNAAEVFHDSDGRTPFMPETSLNQIQEALEHGGFEFRTSTPLREVNAALINLVGVKKDGDLYVCTGAEEYLDICNPANRDW